MALTFEDNRTAHDDLLLTFGESVWRCDSYYFGLDEGVRAGKGHAATVRAVLRALLEHWRAAIGALASGAVAYLPYDFSDQCTAWLACERAGDQLSVRHGWASVEGWSITPSAPPAPAVKPAGFQPDGGPWPVSVGDFLDGIARSIAALA